MKKSTFHISISSLLDLGFDKETAEKLMSDLRKKVRRGGNEK